MVTNPLVYKPVISQYAIIDTLKKLYPKKFKDSIQKGATNMFNKVNGTDLIFKTMQSNDRWLSTLNLFTVERRQFEEVRKKYLLNYEY